MTGVAALGFAIDSSPAATAAIDLEKMTSAAVKAEQAAGRTGSAGTKMARSFGDLGPTLERLVLGVERVSQSTFLIEKRLAAQGRAAAQAANQNRALDASLGDTSAAYKQLEASLRSVEAAQQRGDASLRTSLATIDKQREAIARLNAELTKLQNHPATLPGASGGKGGGGGANSQSATMALYQFQDIAMTAAGGMSAGMIGLQQGSQLAGGFAGMSMKQVAATTGTALMGLVSPVSIASIALTAGAAAAIQFGIGLATAGDDTKKLDTALDRHADVLKRLEDRYGALIEKAKGFTAESASILKFDTASDVRGLRNATKVAGEEFFDTVGTLTRGGYVADNETFGSGFMMFNEEITKLRNGFKAGKPDFDAFYDSLYRTAELNPEFAKKADELAKLVEQFRQGTRALEEMERVQKAVENAASRGFNDASGGFRNDQIFRQLQMRRDMELQRAELGAKSPEQRAEAARIRERNRFDPLESVETRDMRIEQAGQMELLRSQQQLKDAQIERAANLDRILAGQRQELEYVGKTATETAGLRLAYEQIAALRADAARNGVAADEAEIAAIKRKAEAYGEYAKQINQARFSFDMQQQAADAQLGERDRQIVQKLRGYGMPEDLGSAQAGQIRQQMQFAEIKEGVQSFGQAFTSSFLSQGGSIGDRFGKSIVEPVVGEALSFQFPFAGASA